MPPCKSLDFVAQIAPLASCIIFGLVPSRRLRPGLFAPGHQAPWPRAERLPFFINATWNSSQTRGIGLSRRIRFRCEQAQ